MLPSAGVRVTWHELGPETNEAIAARIALAPGVASVELSFPCPSSDQGQEKTFNTTEPFADLILLISVYIFCQKLCQPLFYFVWLFVYYFW